MTSWQWNYGATTTNATTLTIPITAWTPSLPSAGHVPSYEPPALAEDELGWLRRRITEVTDLFPVTA